MAKLKFYYGTMGSGKTTEALKTFSMYQRKGYNPLIVKPQIDDREGKFNGWGTVKSRIIPDTRPAYYTNNVSKDIYDNPPQDFKVLIVDEAQFFSEADIFSLASIVDDKDIDVICYGLKTDCNGRLFRGAATLLAIADEFKELDNLCDICGKNKPAMHIRYIDGVMDKAGESVAIQKGNIDYKAVCRQCYKKEIVK